MNIFNYSDFLFENVEKKIGDLVVCQMSKTIEK